MRLAKVLRLLLISGLAILLLSLRKKSRIGLRETLYIYFSPYRSLLRIIKAQAKLETNNFQSKVYEVDNNLFGMKVNSRPFESAGLMSPEGDRYAHYESDFLSVKDLIAWMRQTNFPTSVSDVDEYARQLKNRGYYGASLTSYINNLNMWLNGN